MWEGGMGLSGQRWRGQRRGSGRSCTFLSPAHLLSLSPPSFALQRLTQPLFSLLVDQQDYCSPQRAPSLCPINGPLKPLRRQPILLLLLALVLSPLTLLRSLTSPPLPPLPLLLPSRWRPPSERRRWRPCLTGIHLVRRRRPLGGRPVAARGGCGRRQGRQRVESMGRRRVPTRGGRACVREGGQECRQVRCATGSIDRLLCSGQSYLFSRQGRKAQK